MAYLKYIGAKVRTIQISEGREYGLAPGDTLKIPDEISMQSARGVSSNSPYNFVVVESDNPSSTSPFSRVDTSGREAFKRGVENKTIRTVADVFSGDPEIGLEVPTAPAPVSAASTVAEVQPPLPPATDAAPAFTKRGKKLWNKKENTNG